MTLTEALSQRREKGNTTYSNIYLLFKVAQIFQCQKKAELKRTDTETLQFCLPAGWPEGKN